jgi:hypothetical protein
VKSTGAIVDWVGVPSISSGANTRIYVSYDNAGINTPQNTGSLAPANVWDTNYIPIYHLGPGLSLADSTSGGITAANNGATSGTGEIDGAADFNGTSAYITGHQWAAYSAFTVSYWVKFNSLAAYQYMVSSQDGYGDYFLSTLYNVSQFRTYIHTSNIANNTTGSTPMAGLWYHVATVYDGAHVTVYVNGAQDAQMSATGTVNFTASSLEKIGGNPATGHFVSGTMDEYEFSTVARPVAWLLAEYNNQKPTSTFLTVGAEI